MIPSRFALLLCATLAFATPVLTLPLHAETSSTTSAEDEAYLAGTRAMNENRWDDAVTDFDRVVSAKGKKADAALYWKAYSLKKLGKRDLANDTCVQLQAQFRSSTWNRDCRILTIAFKVDSRIRMDQSQIVMVPAPLSGSYGPHSKDPEADMKILALNSLLHRDPAQALPLLRSVLTGSQPSEVKHQALFVLAQSQSPESQALLHDLVLGKMGPELQKQAIQAAGIYQGRRADDMLTEAYQSTSDVQVKHAVISALFVAGDDTRMVTLARVEKDRELKRTIVSQLSIMNGKAANDYMMELLK